MKNPSSEILARVSQLSFNDKSDQIYNDWASHYDEDLVEQFGYISPAITAQALADVSHNRDQSIIDYGCGTGLVGQALKNQGFDSIDGIDIAAEMLEQARSKSIYRHLMHGDLTTGLALSDGCYDAGVCVGSMGTGHVGAQHTQELLRPVKPAGFFVIVMNAQYYTIEGFEQTFRNLEAERVWVIKQLREFNYMSKLTRPGWLLLAQKC